MGGTGGAGASGMAGQGSNPLGPATVRYQAFDYSLVDADAYDFVLVPTGSAAADRTLVVVTHAASDYAVAFDAVTVDGIGATKITSVSEEAAPTAPSAIFTVSLPTGSQSTIHVDLSRTVVRCAIGVYAAYGLVTPSAAYDTGSRVMIGDGSFDLDVPLGGIIVGGLGMAGDPSSASYWTTIQFSYDRVLIEGTPTLVSSGALGDVQTAGTYTIGLQTVNAGYNFRAVAASFR
jgi:hypothetical protein